MDRRTVGIDRLLDKNANDFAFDSVDTLPTRGDAPLSFADLRWVGSSLLWTVPVGTSKARASASIGN